MLNRRSVLLGLTTLAAPTIVQAQTLPVNVYAANYAARFPASAKIARAGDTWPSVFGARYNIVRVFNRQNEALEKGQVYVVPPRSADMMSISPFAPQLAHAAPYQVIISPQRYAWAFYQNHQLVRWGPAICGSDWCRDIGRSCRTPSGNFVVSEVAGKNRRSSSYPIIAAAEGRGALMPWYMRLTDRGVGMHARYVRGRHESHGCVGMFYDDAQWLNVEVARKVPLSVHIESY